MLKRGEMIPATKGENTMGGYVCDHPGTFECFMAGVAYFFIIGPLEILFGLFGVSFDWHLNGWL